MVNDRGWLAILVFGVPNKAYFIWRRRADSNRRIGVLQTPALTSWPRRHGAEEGIRTLDLLLGKETFYQLNYFRFFQAAPDVKNARYLSVIGEAISFPLTPK